jgi:GntR family carbon starvation induced transcriptional regulator
MSESLVEKIIEYIHEDIISLRLNPGQRLHIAQLATQYEVGSGPIREALSRLTSTNLVIAFSQRGFRVAPLSLADLKDVYETRARIEASALVLSIEKGNDEWEAQIIGSYHRLVKFELEHIINNTEEYRIWETRHRAFNFALINACQLTHLLRIQNQLYMLTERYRRQWLIAGLNHQDGLPYAKEQKKIMDAVLARDTPLAVTLLHQHFENAVKVIAKYFLKENLFDAQ